VTFAEEEPVMNPTPKEWPRISSALYYEDAAKAIDFVCDAFGFEVRIKVEGDGGRIEHSELTFGEGVIMVASITEEKRQAHARSPRTLGGANTQSLCVYVDDVDAQCARARAAGATITVEPTTNDYGEEHGAHRSCQVVDPEGHHWWFMQNVRPPKASAK
jgi:uncharacterized glyoxalase superfamily protein PhnB